MSKHAAVAIGLMNVGATLLVGGIQGEKQDEQIKQSVQQHFEVIEADHSADLRFARHAMVYVEPTSSGYLNLQHVAPGVVKSETGLLQLTNLGKGAAKDIRLTFLSSTDECHEVKALERLHLLPAESMTLRAFPGQGFKLNNGKSYVSAVVEFKDHRNQIQTSVTHFQADLDLKRGQLVLTVISNETRLPHDRTKSSGGYAFLSEGLRK